MATGKSSKPGSAQSASPGKGTSSRGFASMDPVRQREIASEGGKAAHEKGTAHEFTSEEARRAGSLSHGNRQAANAGKDSANKGGSSKEHSASSGNQQDGSLQSAEKQNASGKTSR